MTAENLTESLFKDRFIYPETSTLVERIVASNQAYSSALDKEVDYNWYRIITPELWNWRGVPVDEMALVFSSISASNLKRSNDKWLDTVVGYQSGNWIYAFLEQSSQWQRRAEAVDKNSQGDEDKQKRHHYYLLASQYSSIASYPHYHSDKMASYAQTQAYRFYQQAMLDAPYLSKEIEFNLAKGTIKGWLHLPYTARDNVKTCPVVLICSGLGNLQVDFYRYFHDALAPKGIAMLTIDTPSVGNSRKYKLSYNSSELYQGVLDALPNVKWIDANRVILAGFRFGALIAMRLAYLMPSRIKGVVNFKPIIHQAFVDEMVQQNLPTMYKDMLANRIGMSHVSNSLLAAELKYFSLKSQGILSKPCRVPVLSILVENDKLSNQSEVELIQSTVQHKIATYPRKPLQASLQARLIDSVSWMKSILEK